MAEIKQDLSISGSRVSEFPQQIRPMLLHAQKKPFSKEGWVFEPKLDGMRAIALVNNGSCKLLSRTGRNITEVFPHIASELSCLKGPFVLDAEIVAQDMQGRPDFEFLQARWNLSRTRDIERAEMHTPTLLYAFDLLYLDGVNLCGCSYVDRKHELLVRVEKGVAVRVLTSFDDGISLYAACKEKGLEGIVAKRELSKYKEGERSKDWIKIKFTQTESFVIVAFKPDEGFVVARREAEDFKIVGIVQFGLTSAEHQVLKAKLQPLSKQQNTKSNGTILFEPQIWMNVEFMTWTKHGSLRFPVFRGFTGEE